MALPFILGAFALLGVGGSALFLGELNTLVNTIFANSSTILFSGVIATGLFIAYQSATEKSPDLWDNIGVFAGVVGLLLVWLFIVPTVSSQIYGWNAEFEVQASNPAFSDARIDSVEVRSVNKGGQLSLIDIPGVTDKYSGTVTVDCEQSVSKESYGMEILESQSGTALVKVQGIEGNQGDTCEVTTTLSNQDGQIDSFESSFTLGER